MTAGDRAQARRRRVHAGLRRTYAGPLRVSAVTAAASHSTRSVTLRRATSSLSWTKLRTRRSLSGIVQELEHRLVPRRLAGTLRQALVEVLNSHAQNACDLQETARADAVGALLVLLNLLEGEAEAELLLAEAEHHSAHSNAAAHMLIDRARGFLVHDALRSDGSPYRKRPGRKTYRCEFHSYTS